MKTEYCCQEFEENIKENRGLQGGGFEKDEDGAWQVLGCCSFCYTMGPLKYCPFCGKELK